MTEKISYPKTSLLQADVLAAEGGTFYGCYLYGGRVYPALRAMAAPTVGCPGNVNFAAYAEKPAKLFAVAADGLYYSLDGKTFSKSRAEFSARRPFLFDKQDAPDEAYLAGDCTVVEAKPYTNSVKPFDYGIFGGVIKNGRLFALDNADAFKIRWSGEGGGLDMREGINGAGWARIYPEKGKILNLSVYRQRLIAVCEYGLAALSAFGAPENFKLGYIDGSAGKIYANTAAVAGGKLVFFADGGLYAFNGIKVEKLAVTAENITDPACSLAYGENYILSCTDGRTGRGALFICDVQKGTGYMLDNAVTAMCVYGKPYCFGEGGAFVLSEGDGVDFESGAIDFGTPKRKLLKSVHIGGAAVDVEVKTQGKTRILRGVKGYCRPYMRGTDFVIRVRGNGKINGVKAFAEVTDGV